MLLTVLLRRDLTRRREKYAADKALGKLPTKRKKPARERLAEPEHAEGPSAEELEPIHLSQRAKYLTEWYSRTEWCKWHNEEVSPCFAVVTECRRAWSGSA